MAGQRNRLVADAFHQAAVAGDDVGVVVDDVVAEPRVQQTLRQRHADGVGEALAERTGRRLDAGGVPVLGMAGRLGAELAEALQLIHFHARIAGEIEQRIEQHRAVAGRQHEAVAVRPVGIGGVEAHRLAEQHSGDIRHAHRHAGVAGLGRLHRIHGKGADGVGHVVMGDRLRLADRLARLGHRSIPEWPMWPHRDACFGPQRQGVPFGQARLTRPPPAVHALSGESAAGFRLNPHARRGIRRVRRGSAGRRARPASGI